MNQIIMNNLTSQTIIITQNDSDRNEIATASIQPYQLNYSLDSKNLITISSETSSIDFSFNFNDAPLRYISTNITMDDLIGEIYRDQSSDSPNYYKMNREEIVNNSGSTTYLFTYYLYSNIP